MVSKNDITGDVIKSKVNTKAYSDGWERIFGNKKGSRKVRLSSAKQRGITPQRKSV